MDLFQVARSVARVPSEWPQLSHRYLSLELVRKDDRPYSTLIWQHVKENIGTNTISLRLMD